MSEETPVPCQKRQDIPKGRVPAYKRNEEMPERNDIGEAQYYTVISPDRSINLAQPEKRDKTAIVKILLEAGWTADEIFSALYEERD
jgi:hypothetical protein